mgnify:FL=1
MKYRIGQAFLKGDSTLKKYTIIDVYSPGYSFLTLVGDTLKSHELLLGDKVEIYAHLQNGITQPETQDIEGRFMLEPLDQTLNSSIGPVRLPVGQRVTFKAELKEATLSIQGFIIRSFWNDYYLISEMGVSVPNRHWKVSFDRVEVS